MSDLDRYSCVNMGIVPCMIKKADGEWIRREEHLQRIADLEAQIPKEGTFAWALMQGWSNVCINDDEGTMWILSLVLKGHGYFEDGYAGCTDWRLI